MTLAQPPAVPDPPPSELLHVARRMVWFKPPEETLRDPVLLLCHAMTYGTPRDLAVVRRCFDDDALRATLRAAHPGIFDPRSWTYWHVVLDMQPTPPLPTRRFARVAR